MKYSLRSVEKYASWINNIYIITDNQIPTWLNTENPKISIINHREIMPQKVLPTFNSNAILHSMVNIPNLSEYFLYSDDDMFFYDYVKPNFFFNEQGKPICRFGSKIKNVKQGLWKQMLINAVNCLKRKKYCFQERRTHHNIDAYRKSVILDCQNEFKNEINETIRNKFRTENDIERLIYTLYAIAKKRGIFKKVYSYKLTKPLWKRCIKQIFYGEPNDSLYSQTSDISKIRDGLNLYKPKLFCINDDESINEKNLEQIHILLESIFPEKSSFEK